MLNLNCYRLLLGVAVLSLGAAARAQQQEPPPAPPASPTPPPDAGGEDQPGPRFRIGPEVGFYFPSNSKTRDAFGSRFLNLGIGLGTVTQKSARGALAFDLSIVTNRNKEANIFIAPVGVAYAVRLGNGGPSVVPFAGASLNAFVVNMKTTKGDYDVKSGFRGGVGGSVFLGTTFSGSAYVQARYLIATKVSGFDLAGLNLTLGYRF
jgi:hypothetical protein